MAEEVKKESANKKDVDEFKIHAVLAYFGILVLVPILTAKESKFAQYHANQGVILLIAGLIVGAASSVPIIGWFLIGPAGSIFLLVLAVMGIINAVNGEMKPLPLIGNYTILK